MNNNQWYKIQIIKKDWNWFEGRFMYDNYTLIGSYENSALNYGSHNWVIRQWKYSNTYDYWDYVLVRKYAPQQPIVEVISD